ncbi:MAG: hypothetical protein GOMPHAMPRED_004992 [Gomphillus americanus]|uniref:Uncharacterized protein n=1 Tax=Gomphillus americanus TaxID=1940652 RepID=A0A8H3HXX0_9LECA|nr:MAG: hypothetical protein GOMPHAMPRED_004992 [Gomphillus americanus]
MGQEASKVSPTNPQHVFKSSGPVRFSPEVVDILQNSPASDSIRAQDLELHIQNRVHTELSRLAEEQTKSLKELQDKISSETPAPSSKSPDLSRASVQKETEELKKKLAKRKLREDVVGDKNVEKAKDELVTCLRNNDRRPLDCWQEVEAFKNEVSRIEKRFLSRVLE